MKMRGLFILLLSLAACGAGGADNGGQVEDGGDSGDSRNGDSEGPTCGNGVLDSAELCDGPPVDCTSLAAVWASGSAPCRGNCSGRDVTACVLGPQLTESVRPAERDPRWANALCNDGTTFDVQVSMASPRSDKWLIYLEGGGICDGTVQKCTGRPAALTSSSSFPADRAPVSDYSDNGTILSRDATTNPQFFDANYVYGKYCSSDIWSGTNTAPQPIQWKKDGPMSQWVFTGRNNARAMIEVAIRDYGIDDATSQVLFTGNSAGGAGAQINLDQIAARMPSSVADGRLAMIASAAWESGLFDDPHYSYYNSGHPSSDVMAVIDGIYEAELDPKCAVLAAAQGLTVDACTTGLLAYTTATSAQPTGWGVRTLIAKNRVDQGTMNDYGLPVVAACDARDLAARQEWLDDMTTSMATIKWLYAPADPQETDDEENLHGMVVDPAVWTFAPDGFGGKTLRDLVSDFWLARTTAMQGERMEFTGDVPHETDSPR